MKYILHPGQIRSRTDGQIHYISAAKLARLYGLNLADCIVHKEPKNYVFDVYDIHLHPRFDGDYTLPPISGKPK